MNTAPMTHLTMSATPSSPDLGACLSCLGTGQDSSGLHRCGICSFTETYTPPRQVIEYAVKRLNNRSRLMVGDWSLLRDEFIVLDGDRYVVNESKVNA